LSHIYIENQIFIDEIAGWASHFVTDASRVYMVRISMMRCSNSSLGTVDLFLTRVL
jgi:hypothetical protein